MNRNTSRRTFLGVAASFLATVAVSGAAFASPQKPPTETATIAAGCFWSMEAIFKQLKGVQQVVPGYAGGTVVKPSYEAVETGTTGHAEALRVVFDPSVISYRDLVTVLLTVRNPTTKDRQGNDVGSQYRSVIYYHSPAQKQTAEAVIADFTRRKVWDAPIITAVSPYKNFYSAESYHFDYYKLHPDQPYCKFVIAPEITEFRTKFKGLLK